MRFQIEQINASAASHITFSSGGRPRVHTRLSSPWGLEIPDEVMENSVPQSPSPQLDR